MSSWAFPFYPKHLWSQVHEPWKCNKNPHGHCRYHHKHSLFHRCMWYWKKLASAVLTGSFSLRPAGLCVSQVMSCNREKQSEPSHNAGNIAEARWVKAKHGPHPAARRVHPHSSKRHRKPYRSQRTQTELGQLRCPQQRPSTMKLI